MQNSEIIAPQERYNFENMANALNDEFSPHNPQPMDLSGMLPWSREDPYPASGADGANYRSHPMTRTGGIYSQNSDYVGGERRALSLQYNGINNDNYNNFAPNANIWGSGAINPPLRRPAWKQSIYRHPNSEISWPRHPNGVYSHTYIGRPQASRNDEYIREPTVPAPSFGSLASIAHQPPPPTTESSREPFCHDIPLDTLIRSSYQPIAPLYPSTLRYTMEGEIYIGANNATHEQLINPTIFRQTDDDEELEMTEQQKRESADMSALVQERVYREYLAQMRG